MDRGKLGKILSTLIINRNNSNKIIPINYVKNKASRFIQIDEVRQKQLEEKAKFWIKKYEDLTGYTKVSELQDKVLEFQKEVYDAQEHRRKVQEELIVVSKKLQETQDLLHKTTIQDQMHITYVTQVRDQLMEQKRIQDLLSLCDQTEKEQQVNLYLAIKHSHDNANDYKEKTKFLSIISGVLCGVAGMLISSIISWQHRRNFRTLSSHVSHDLEASKEEIRTDLRKEMEQLVSVINNNQETLLAVNNNQETLLDSSKMDKISLENSINSKLKTHTLVNLGMTSLLLMGSVILFLSSR